MLKFLDLNDLPNYLSSFDLPLSAKCSKIKSALAKIIFS